MVCCSWKVYRGEGTPFFHWLIGRDRPQNLGFDHHRQRLASLVDAATLTCMSRHWWRGEEVEWWNCPVIWLRGVGHTTVLGCNMWYGTLMITIILPGVWITISSNPHLISKQRGAPWVRSARAMETAVPAPSAQLPGGGRSPWLPGGQLSPWLPWELMRELTDKNVVIWWEIMGLFDKI